MLAFSCVMFKQIMFVTCMHLLKTELWRSHFQYIYWLTGHKLSVHIPVVPMVKERVSNKAN